MEVQQMIPANIQIQSTQLKDSDMDVPLDLQHAARSICRWMAENNVVNWRLDHLASRDELERVEKELTELRAFKAACEGQEVEWYLWENRDEQSLSKNCGPHPNYDITPLYLNPDPEAAQLRQQVVTLTEQRDIAVEALEHYEIGGRDYSKKAVAALAAIKSSGAKK